MNLLKFSCNLSGYDYNEAKQQNHKSKNRITTYGVVMLIPMTLWFINGTILGSRLFELNIIFSMGIGAILCSIIWIFERSIIHLEKSKYLSAFRIILGGLFALLGSFLLDEIIFQNDISDEIILIKKEERERSLQILDNKHQLALNELNTNYTDANEWAKQKQTEATKEADGTGGTRSRGFKRVAQQKQNVADQAFAKANALELDKRRLIDNYTTNRLTEEDNFNEEFNKNSLLRNMTAMFRVISNSFWARIIWLIFTLILAAFEFLVIIIKMVSNPTDYEDFIELQSVLKKSELNAIRENKERMLQAGLNPYYNLNKPQFNTN